MTRIRNVLAALAALTMAGCMSSEAYTTMAECEKRGGTWKQTGGGGSAMAGDVFPSCSNSKMSAPPLTGPTVIGRSGTVLR